MIPNETEHSIKEDSRLKWYPDGPCTHCRQKTNPTMPVDAASTGTIPTKVDPDNHHHHDDDIIDMNDNSNGLRIFQPAMEAHMRDLLTVISDGIQRLFLPTFDATAIPIMDGIRIIQKGRLEMFVHVDCYVEKSTFAFDQLCQLLLAEQRAMSLTAASSSSFVSSSLLLPAQYDSVEAIRTALVSHAQQATRMEKRLINQVRERRRGRNEEDHEEDNDIDVHYGPMSLIISNGIVSDQLPHVDVQPPDFQFGLILTENSPGTIVYESIREIVTTSKQLATFLGIAQNNRTSKIASTVSELPEAIQLLKTFGVCLSTLRADDYKVACRPEHLPTGTVLSLPGGQLHAGPKCDNFRAVLFWTAHGNAKSLYHPDIQYFDGLLLGELMLPIWRFITEQDRYILLQHLLPAARKYPALYGHFANVPQFQDFVHRLSTTEEPEHLMKVYAKKSTLAPMPIGYPIEGEILQCVSAPHLATAAINDDPRSSHCPIVVYRRPNGFVCLQVRGFVCFILLAFSDRSFAHTARLQTYK
jgi:hypothetical protein